MDDLESVFAKYDDEYGEFDRITNKLSRRPDLHAFMLLDSLVPGDGTSDIVSAAEHDIIYLGVDLDALRASGITEDQVRDLVRCGVRLDIGLDSLTLFV